MLIRCALVAGSAVLALGSVAGCGDAKPANGDESALDVVAAFYPLEFVTTRVGGNAARVATLAQPGAEPHDLELTLRQVSELSQADLVVRLKGFQPAVDDAVAQEGADRAFDVAAVEPLLDTAAGGHEHEGEAAEEAEHAEEAELAKEGTGAKDPHVWLDPIRLATIADKIAERLGQIDAPRAADYTARAKELRAQLVALDEEYQAGLKTCKRREIVTSHAAFGYLAKRYDLEQIAITGLSPEAEPSPQRLIDVAKEAREHGATTIFFETLVSPAVAKTIAGQVGAKTAVLDPVEGLPPGSTGDYFTVMRANLTALTAALECS
jgi:zinc transport system substrate-binding protein